MSSYAVYCHELFDGRKYYGVTSQKIAYRWNGGRGYKKQTYFYRAILKYGWGRFRHTVLYENLPSEQAFEKETELIKEHKTTDRRFGFNLSTGGEAGGKGCILSLERRQRMSQERKGHIIKEETKRKISESLKGHYVSQETKEKIRAKNTGKKHSEETKEKLRLIAKTVPRKPMSEQGRKNIGDAQRGRKQSAESNRKRSETLKGRNVKLEHKLKMENGG